MNLCGPSETRLVGDYILGPRIGSGSFAVVWRSRHRKSGHEVAVKEIDKKQLSPKIRESLVKEIYILSTINHPNIIRLLEAIESEDRIYLVLEYCDGGDLAAYIHRHGKVSENVARHFMRQLAAGLQVLQEKHLIHRDLKPQNLLLSANKSTPLLKIGDFGFARSLTPQGLADTLCGSPLYMAPEIIQNKKYDAKADLWSVGAILFQLVTGRPPFDGNSQFQLFQNILASTELKFPVGALEELHSDCVDLCRSLLRQNPVERLSFKEFFCHNFLQEPRPMLNVKQSSLLLTKSIVKWPDSYDRTNVLPPAPANDIFTEPENIDLQEKYEGTSSAQAVCGHMPAIASGVPRESIEHKPSTSNEVQVSDSMEAIERDYVLVNAHLTSVECISYFRETSSPTENQIRDSTNTTKQTEQAKVVVQTELASSSVDRVESSHNHEADSFSTPSTSTMLREVQGLTILHPSMRLQLLHQYVGVLAELSQEKHVAQLYLESLSVELVILAVWKKALQICNTWLASTAQNEDSASCSVNEPKLFLERKVLLRNTEESVDFSYPSAVLSWVEKSFLLAFNRAEKLEHHIRNMDGTADMPDAMEVVFQKALEFGTAGAVDEFVNKSSAADSYSKALLLLSFILGEATTLSLNPSFVLTPDNKKRIQQYIKNLHSRQTTFLKSQPSLNQLFDSPTK